MNIQINEITNNRKYSEMDVWRMSFYVVQTFDRFALMNKSGYAVAEEVFAEESGDTVTTQFNEDCQAHLDFADVNLGKNLQLILKFIQLNGGEKQFIQDYLVAPYYYAGGLNDFLYETLPQCLTCHSLIAVGVMETYFEPNELHYLFIHFFAKLKLIYGALDAEDCPEFDLVEEHIHNMDIDMTRFSLRELTLLSE